jgi:hypothetical protein
VKEAISRDEIINLLKNYHAEREAVQKMIACMKKDGESVYYPNPTELGNKVQVQFNQGEFLDDLLRRCESERRVYRTMIQSIKELSFKLDLLISCVNSLPGHLKLAVIDTMIGDETIEDFAKRNNKSCETIVRYRSDAVDKIFAKMNKPRVRTT